MYIVIVGGGSIQKGRLTHHCKDFVEWANGANIEAVFVGHTHQNWGYYKVVASKIDDPEEIINSNGRTINEAPTTLTTIWFEQDTGQCYSPAYIETEASTFIGG